MREIEVCTLLDNALDFLAQAKVEVGKALRLTRSENLGRAYGKINSAYAAVCGAKAEMGREIDKVRQLPLGDGGE